MAEGKIVGLEDDVARGRGEKTGGKGGGTAFEPFGAGEVGVSAGDIVSFDGGLGDAQEFGGIQKGTEPMSSTTAVMMALPLVWLRESSRTPAFSERRCGIARGVLKNSAGRGFAAGDGLIGRAKKGQKEAEGAGDGGAECGIALGLEVKLKLGRGRIELEQGGDRGGEKGEALFPSAFAGGGG